ncbi:hypothetical protein PG997_008799 [Apiospora hydei]|uniref:Uncharacterized protein n=1 Tax=Apiospora hydei TaxID=1337664 RepID=A0ABR1WBV3_9PEZI
MQDRLEQVEDELYDLHHDLTSANDLIKWQENQVRHAEEYECERRAMYFELGDTKRRHRKTQVSLRMLVREMLHNPD